MDYSYFKQKKILLVDDEAEILNMVSDFFKKGRIYLDPDGGQRSGSGFHCKGMET